MTAIAIALTLILGATALLHGYWAAGGVWPGRTKTELAAIVVGRPQMRDMPSTGLTVFVAIMIAGIAAWPLLLSPLVAQHVAPQLALAGNLVAAAVFALRGTAGYSQAMARRHSAQPFATYNRRYYSPICLVLSAGFLILALYGAMA